MNMEILALLLVDRSNPIHCTGMEMRIVLLFTTALYCIIIVCNVGSVMCFFLHAVLRLFGCFKLSQDWICYGITLHSRMLHS